MLTEKEIQSFEELIQQLSERRRHHTSRQLNEVLQSHRELQAENASLRSQIATETAKVELMDRQIAGLVEHQHKMRMDQRFWVARLDPEIPSDPRETGESGD